MSKEWIGNYVDKFSDATKDQLIEFVDSIDATMHKMVSYLDIDDATKKDLQVALMERTLAEKALIEVLGK